MRSSKIRPTLLLERGRRETATPPLTANPIPNAGERVGKKTTFHAIRHSNHQPQRHLLRGHRRGALLSQAQSDRAILAKQLGISEHQLSYITHSNSGEGLLFYGNVTIPFVDRFPKGEIYNLLTTRPEDMAHERKDE